MKTLVSSLLLLPVVSFALPVKKGEQFRVQIPGEYIVKTNSQKINFPVEKKLGKNLFLVKNLNQKSLKGVEKVYPNYAYYGEYKEGNNLPNDAEFSKQYHHKMIRTTDAWNITKGDKELIVAVTDNEFQIDHKDLQDSWWVNKNEIPDNGIDDDNNGYIDDVYGWDFVEKDNDVDSTVQTTHGTHVAGIIAASANNGMGGVGIAPNVKVMPLRWYGDEAPWTSAIVVETYHYAIANGAKIISTSYGIDGLATDKAYLDVIQFAKENEVLVFNSAGNNSQKNPARQSIEDVILVCSVKSADAKGADKKSSFSNYGTGIDICAPGDPIYAPVQARSGVQDKYGNLQGTSMAAPAAAAVAALIWSAHPNFSAEEVKQRLYDSADDIDSKNWFWFRGFLGAGRINAYKAVQ